MNKIIWTFSLFVSIFSLLSVPFTVNSSAEVSGAGVAGLEDHLYLSEVGWEAYSDLMGIDLAVPIPSLGDLQEIVKRCLHHDGIATEKVFLEEEKYSHSPPNTAVVRVFYQTEDGRIYHKEIPHVFISGWQQKAELNISFFGEAYTPVYLGDFYRIAEGKTIRSAHASEIHSRAGASLRDDFLIRGIDVLERKSGGDPKVTFSCDAYAHSEQAFVSYLQNDPRAVISPTANPQSVLIHIMSTRDPCSNCRIIMERLMYHPDFKKGLLKRMFPEFVDRDVPVNIIYGSYKEFQKNEHLLGEI